MLLGQCDGDTIVPSTKTIVYRGGIASFELPATWHEEYADDGGATSWDDVPDSGTLRLNVISFSSPHSSKDMVSSMVAKGFEVADSGLAFMRREETGVQDEDHLHIFWWEIAIPVEPRSMRLALFSHTILASQTTDPAIRAEVDWLERSIRAGTYSREPGVVHE